MHYYGETVNKQKYAYTNHYLCQNCSCVKGTLVEINDKLVTNPELLRSAVKLLNQHIYHACTVCDFLQPLSDGYIAIILPKFSEAETVCSHLLSAEEYEQRKHTDSVLGKSMTLLPQ